jgi:hypothetical protein
MPLYPPFEDDGYPDDWFVPSSSTAPSPFSAASAQHTGPTYPSFPNPNASQAGLGPFQSWLLANRLGSAAWNPPSSPDTSAPFGLTPSASASLNNIPWSAGENGLFGGFGRMMAEREQANDPWQLAANGLLGGIAKLIAAEFAKHRRVSWSSL